MLGTLLTAFILETTPLRRAVPEMATMKTTAYTAEQGAITRSGQAVREGIAASTKDRLGQVAMVYKKNAKGKWEFLDMLEITDTGGKGVAKGTVLDRFCATEEDCQEWCERTYGETVWVQFIEGKG